MSSDHHYVTAIGVATEDSISVLGRDLPTQLVGRVGFVELAFELITLRAPSPQEARLLDAVLVTLADHGLTPTVIAARMTLLGAPESIQGALAAGLLGGGSRLLGVTEDTGRFLAQVLAECDVRPEDEAGWDAVAEAAMRRCTDGGVRVPGLGHHLHRNGDPRTDTIVALAREEGVFGDHLALYEAMGRMASRVIGRAIPLNGAGACGAAMADVGIPVELLRGVALLARCAGLLGHLAEELRHPLAHSVYHDLESRAVYDASPVGEPEATKRSDPD